jgi:hypothetical protein
MNGTDKTILFLHIPKTAGTTLTRIIARQYRPEEIWSFDETHNWDDFVSLSEAYRARFRLIQGHMIFGVHELVRRPCAYFTFLRDPIERTISEFHFARRTPMHHYYDWINGEKLGLKEFLESGVPTMFDNGQTRMLSGDWFRAGFGQCSEEVLAAATINLHEHFAVIGLTERFDASLLLLQRALGWKQVFYVRQNVADRRPQQANLSPDTLEVVRQCNQLDIKLYEQATRLFDEQVAAQGPDFERQVRAFQAANRFLTWPVYAYWGLRKRSVRVFVRDRLQRLREKSQGYSMEENGL